MVQPEPIRPETRSSSPASGQHHVPDGDIDLPPIPDSLSGGEPSVPVTADRATGGATPPKRRSNSVWGFGALAAVVIAGWFFFSGPSAEVSHPNWQHVASATEAASTTDGALLHIDDAGTQRVITAIEVAAADADPDTTNAVRQAIRRNDAAAVKAAILAAQEIPADGEVEPQVADISPDSSLHNELEKGRTKFYRLHVFDCCDEDGDVVEVVVNGQPLITIPITHAGATIAIPLAPGSNSVAIRGIRDGQGGITVSFRTSEGEYFSRVLGVGEEHQLGVIVQ